MSDMPMSDTRSGNPAQNGSFASGGGCCGCGARWCALQEAALLFPTFTCCKLLLCFLMLAAGAGFKHSGGSLRLARRALLTNVSSMAELL
jgi:hypothetical protein